MNQPKYTVTIHWSVEDNCFIAERGGCDLKSHGDTRAEALANLENVTSSLIELSQRDGWKLFGKPGCDCGTHYRIIGQCASGCCDIVRCTECSREWSQAIDP